MESPLDTRHHSLLALAALVAVLAGILFPMVPFQAALWAQEGETEAVSPPRMVFSSVTWDAGLVERGAVLTHEFTFRNEGGSDLVILSTKAG